MMEELNNILINGILGEDNVKIKEYENVDEYFKSFKNDQLTRLAITNIFVNEKYGDLFKVRNLANKPKKYIIDYVKENIEDIFETYIKICDTEVLNDIKKILKNGGNVVYSFKDFDMYLRTIMFLKNYAIARVYYEKKNHKIHIYIPEEIVKILSSAIHNTSIVKTNNRNNSVYNTLIGIVEAYGVISFEELYKMYKSLFLGFDENEVIRIANFRSMYDDIFNVYLCGDINIIANMEFHDEERAISYYEDIKGSYRVFSKSDLELFSKNEYIYELKSYKNYNKFLNSNFQIPKEDMKEIDLLIVMEYITVAQTCIEEAERSFFKNIKEEFELDEQYEKKILHLVKEIFKEYPKWEKRGNK